MKKWINLLNSMGIEFNVYNKKYINIWGYDLNITKFERIIAVECIKHGSWLAHGQEIYTMADGTEITITL